MLRVPAVVRNKAITSGHAAWLVELPGLVRDVESEWGLSLGRIFPDATEALVGEIVLADGTEAVLKVPVPGESDTVGHEAEVLRLDDGRSCARLLRIDLDRGVLLLERLGPSLHDLRLPLARRHEILCDTVRRMWRRPAPGHGLPSGADKGRWLAEFVVTAWEETGRPCTTRAVEHAVACAESRVADHDDARSVLVHGDVHEWNVLRAADGRFKLIDPDGLLGAAEYDLGVVMREDPVELMSGDPYARAEWLAARTGLDPVAIWEWGVAERVATGLLAERIGLQPVGRQMLDAADALAERR